MITILMYGTHIHMLSINYIKTIIKSLHTRRTSTMVVEFISKLFQTLQRETSTNIAQSFSEYKTKLNLK